MAGKDLPELKDMLQVRNGLLIVIFILFLFPAFNVFTHAFDYESQVDPFIQNLVYLDNIYTEERPWYYGLDVYAQMLILFLFVFVFVFDFSIYKRFGKEHSILDYS